MSAPGSARDTPAQGQVKFVPSMRNRFSLPPEPNAEMLWVVPLAEPLPLDGDVGDIPGAARIKSNMLYRRVGIVPIKSCPKRVSNPPLRASMRDPDPSTPI